jgi:hypothetical protein
VESVRQSFASASRDTADSRGRLTRATGQKAASTQGKLDEPVWSTPAQERDNGLANRTTVAERDSMRDDPVPRKPSN